MMVFSGKEIMLSVIYAIIYGFGFSLFYQALLVLSVSIKLLPNLFVEILRFERIMPPPSAKKNIKNGKSGPILAFFSVLLFFIGFIIISYIFLDGEIRVYMLFLSSASLFVLYSAFCDFFKNIFSFFFDLILLVVSTLIRSLVLPFKKIYIILNNKITRK